MEKKRINWKTVDGNTDDRAGEADGNGGENTVKLLPMGIAVYQVTYRPGSS